MSSSNTTDTTSTSPGPTSSKQHTSVCETVKNDHSTNGKDLLHSLKGQVSFAKQCLGLLQNQMKHAMDTLEILQDQVIKAQSTIDKIERKASKQVCSQKVQSVVVGNDYQTSVDELPPGAVPLQGHRMLVVDSNGQPLYAIDKSAAASYGIPIQHQGSPCHCPSCNNVSLGHPVFLTEQGQQLIAIHSGQAVYHIDGKQASSSPSSSHDSVEKKEESHTATTPEYSKKRKYSATSLSDTEESPRQSQSSPRQSQSSNEPNASKSLSDSKSASPIASQLLQVIDVLQNAGDDDNKESVISVRSLRGHSSTIPFTGPVPHNPVHTPSGAGIFSVGRRCRKQDMSPFREEGGLSPHLHTTERDLPELMRVPPPVLAGSLEPDFLVVPGNSYFSDSPPTSAACGSRERERLGPRERSHSETRTSSVVEVKKEQIEKVQPPRPSSASSLSQASDASSRSASESGSSDKCASQSVDVSRRLEVTTEGRVARIHEHEHTAREQDVEKLSAYSKNYPNGDSHKSDDVDITKSTHSITIPTARTSLLNSASSDKDATDTTQLSPKKSQVRLIKVSPLNSAVTGSTMELHRPPADYTSNHGIVRISHATSMSSSNPCAVSRQTKNAPTESPTFPSNDVHKSSLNSYTHSCNANSDIQVVTTYSVAEIASDEQKCPSPSKRPNILSRNRPNKKEIPQGIVVLVPTIEDAKQLIKSSGGNKGSTPVLVPQNVLTQISANGEPPKSTTDSHVTSTFTGKRSHYSESSLSYSRAKRSHSEPLVID